MIDAIYIGQSGPKKTSVKSIILAILPSMTLQNLENTNT